MQWSPATWTATLTTLVFQNTEHQKPVLLFFGRVVIFSVESFSFFGFLALDLLKKLLLKDPSERISAKDALQHKAILGLKTKNPAQAKPEEQKQSGGPEEKSNLKEFHDKYSQTNKKRD